jgi:hypothetical protein
MGRQDAVAAEDHEVLPLAYLSGQPRLVQAFAATIPASAMLYSGGAEWLQ